MAFSIIVPTYNREKDFRNCLDSVLLQVALPSEILIIDDGGLSDIFLLKLEEKFKEKNISFLYHKKNHEEEPRGLSESKNIAINLVNNDIFFILDDDLILDKDFFEKIMNTWKENKNDKKLIGVGGIIKNNRKKIKIEKIYNKVFGLTSNYSWDINSAGFQVWNEQIGKAEKGYYVHGGVCSYRKFLVEKLGEFATFGGGRTANEDIDFCIRAKNEGYHFIVEPNAKVIHKQSKTSREKDFLIGFKESYNRKIIFKDNYKKSLKSYLWFYWANVGWILRQFLVGNFSRGFGMIKGLFTLIK
jgi:GT2 family glycosyltransferase